MRISLTDRLQAGWRAVPGLLFAFLIACSSAPAQTAWIYTIPTESIKPIFTPPATSAQGFTPSKSSFKRTGI